MNWISKRFNEPSTWAGFAAVATILGGLIPPEAVPDATAGAAPWVALAGAIGAILKGEKGEQ